MQYLAMTGPLNMRLAAPEKWANIKEVVEKDASLKERGLDLGFLDEINLPQNVDLGSFVEGLYSGISGL